MRLGALAPACGDRTQRRPHDVRRARRTGRPGRIIGAMTIATSHGTARLLRAARFGLLALVSVLVAHDAIFAAQYGFGAAFADAMRAGGHDPYWPILSTLAVVAATLLGLRAILRLGHLRSTEPPNRPVRATASFGHVARSYRRELVILWPPLFALVSVAFGVQENAEHLLGHGHLIGIGAVTGPEYPLALPVIALVTLLAAAVGALVRWRIAVLQARLAGRLHPTRPRGLTARRAHPGWADVAAIRAHAWFLVRLDAGRAPPHHA